MPEHMMCGERACGLEIRDLNEKVPRLRSLHNVEIVVYGYTDNLQVGPQLQRAGIAANIDLSSKRADAVVTFLVSQGVNPNIISAKGLGDTHPEASNTPRGRTQNGRIEIAVRVPGLAMRVGPPPTREYPLLGPPPATPAPAVAPSVSAPPPSRSDTTSATPPMHTHQPPPAHCKMTA